MNRDWFWFYCFMAMTLNAKAQIFVSPDGMGSGVSWQESANLITALKKAEKGSEIWLTAGIYFPTQCTFCTESDKMVSFEIPDGVEILGGFAGHEQSKSERDWVLHKTILSGDINQDGTFEGNAYTVLITKNVGNKTLIDGLTITMGNANGTDSYLESPHRSGGGMYNHASTKTKSNPIIRNCIFENNQASSFGGAVYNFGGYEGTCNPEFQNCRFINNQSRYDGGAIYSNGSFGGTCDFILFNCQFIGNFAGTEIGSGGALFNNGIKGTCNPKIENCRFENQEATLHGGAIYNQGKSGDASPEIINCIFSNNKAIQAGAIYNLGANPDGNSSPKIVNCTFFRNVARDWGGVFAVNGDLDGSSRPFIANCIFAENKGLKNGNEFFQINGHSQLSNCLIDAKDCKKLEEAYQQVSTITCQAGMIFNEKPKFIAPESGNFNLQYNSAAIDAGNDSIILSETDIRFKPRILLAHTDLGAYEYDGPVPTKTDGFDAVLVNDTVEFYWNTRSEYENAGFEILKSKDSVHFNRINWEPSAGDHLGLRNYSVQNPSLPAGKFYYFQLVQVDNDGCFRTVGQDTLFIPPKIILYELSPNPADVLTTLKIYLPYPDRHLNVRLVSAIGHRIWEISGEIFKGWTTFDFDVSSLGSGMYFFQIEVGEEKKVLPFVKITR